MMGSAIRAAAFTCVALLVAVGIACASACSSSRQITVGFIYDNDVDTPYSSNFLRAQEALEREFQSEVRVMAFSSVFEEELADPMEELVANGASIVFTNNYGNMRVFADQYPEIEICQASNDPYPDDEARPNYHTFKGEVYQGRYVSGVIAGIKLEQMIEEGLVEPEDAKVGFVAAFPYPEVISGYTAFLLGVRSVVGTATMDVVYTYTWENYMLERDCATMLLDNGCQIISQHTDTEGPAVACEEYYDRDVYHVGYNQSMAEVAPNASLASTCICWSPYIVEAVHATIDGKGIEDAVKGAVHPKNDMSAGFDEGWVEILGLNERLLPEGASARIEEAMAEMRDGTNMVFVGDYIGVNPDDPNDVVDLSEGFRENDDSSIPTFHYVLRDVVNVLPDEEVGIHGRP